MDDPLDEAKRAEYLAEDVNDIAVDTTNMERHLGRIAQDVRTMSRIMILFTILWVIGVIVIVVGALGSK